MQLESAALCKLQFVKAVEYSKCSCKFNCLKIGGVSRELRVREEFATSTLLTNCDRRPDEESLPPS